mmetsp:Transcript_9371/g.11611  ORF Transcript_9371/g.11611 Transcript_9371/m.11611 type:complete len:471 (-) Transcript_9371:553-1965(-)
MPPRLLIVGGGPIGLEMAVAAVQSKKWDVTIAERGNELCANVVAWEHVHLFSAWKLNISEAGRAALTSLGIAIPECKEIGEEAKADYPTGKEFLNQYLRPLGKYVSNSEHCKVMTETNVVSIGKSTLLLKGDMGKIRRKSASFRTLVVRDGMEEIIISDAVVDASGTYGNGNWLGIGGIPALGERTFASNIIRTIPNVAEDAARYLNKTTAVVGSAYSAITTISKLKDLAAANTAATVNVHWCTRRGNDDAEGSPLYEKIENDPLPQREALSKLANALAIINDDRDFISVSSTVDEEKKDEETSTNFRLIYHPRVQLESITNNVSDSNGTVNLLLRDVQSDTDEMKVIEEVSTVIANVGFRPDSSIYQELQVHQCYASEGPMNLAAALMSSSGAGSVDCLAQVAPGKETMINPEPSFYIVGMKSYGRSSKFLLSIGHEQVKHVMELLKEDVTVLHRLSCFAWAQTVSFHT